MSTFETRGGSNPPVPYVRILHQPSSIYRMRYKAENRTTFLFSETVSDKNAASSDSASPTTTSTGTINKKNIVRKKNGALNAVNPDGLYPKIEIVNGQGPATLIVSCVNYKEPYHVHPHRLVGECCKSGVAVINIGRGETQFELAGVSIQFTKRHDIQESINELKSKNVDPFNVGFNFDQSSIDLSQLRLCFQVYLRESLETNEIIRDQYHILKPVVSNIIYNSARKSTLQIVKQASMSSPANGGGLVILFIKKLEKDQKILKAKFYEPSLNSNATVWESEIELKDDNIHQQCAIMFPAPAYKDRDSTENKKVFLKLYVPFKDDKDKQEFLRQQNTDDNEENYDNSNIDGRYESKPIEFIYTPSEFKLNKRKLDTEPFYFASTFLEQSERDVLNDDNKAPRKNLAKKFYSMLSNQINLENTAISELIFTANNNSTALATDTATSKVSSTDPIINNFIIKNAEIFIPLNQQQSITEQNSQISSYQMQTFINDRINSTVPDQPMMADNASLSSSSSHSSSLSTSSSLLPQKTSSITTATTASTADATAHEPLTFDMIDFENISGPIYDVIETIDKQLYNSN